MKSLSMLSSPAGLLAATLTFAAPSIAQHVAGGIDVRQRIRRRSQLGRSTHLDAERGDVDPGPIPALDRKQRAGGPGNSGDSHFPFLPQPAPWISMISDLCQNSSFLSVQATTPKSRIPRTPR